MKAFVVSCTCLALALGPAAGHAEDGTAEPPGGRAVTAASAAIVAHPGVLMLAGGTLGPGKAASADEAASEAAEAG